MRNSILGLVDVYNLLPAEVVQHVEVKKFQTELQGLLKLHAANGENQWEMLFSPRMELYNHPLRRLLNRVRSMSDGNWENDNGGTFAPMVNANATTDLATTHDVPPAWW